MARSRGDESLWLPGFETAAGIAVAAEPDDAAARERALHPAHSFVVQAPAGSGKTELLIQRYLTLLARVAEPEAIVAITFTIKAAGEMRGRVLEALHQAAGPEPAAPYDRRTWRIAQAALERDRQAGWNLTQNPGRMRIQTIDALSMSMTRQMPLIARFGAMPDVTDKPQPFYERAAAATLRLLAGDDAAARAIETLLRHVDNDAAYARGLLARMLETRDHWMRIIGTASDLGSARGALESTLCEVIMEYLSALAQAMPDEIGRELADLGRYAGANVDTGHDIAACRELRALPDANAECLPAWRGMRAIVLTNDGNLRKTIDSRSGFPKGNPHIRQRWGKLIADLGGRPDLLDLLRGLDDLPPPRYADAQWRTLEALFAILPAAAAQLRLVFAEAGLVDFTEIAHAALRALGSPDSPTDLALTMGARIEHLLVDEFQDTSIVQYELLKALTAGWERGDGRTLFAVGDPMQSIYRFRQAEVGLMLAIRREGLGAILPESLRLTTNFRSVRPLVDWMNTSFAPAFPPSEDPYTGAVPHAPSTPWDRSDEGGVLVHPLLSRDDEAEADLALRLIQEEQRINPNAKIAVLVRARRHLTKIADRLRRRRLPFRAIEIEALGDRAVVDDLVALTRALIHLADRTSWLAILRAPWCGLVLADLHAIAAPDPRGAIWDALNRPDLQLSADGAERLARIRPFLERAIAARGRTPLRMLVERTWIALGGPACTSSDADLEDATTYFDLLDETAYGGDIVDFDSLAQRASDLFAAPDPEAGGLLELMTMHKAKGLEFDTVILPGLGRAPRSEDSKLLLWTERPSTEGEKLLLAPISARREETDALWKYIAGQEKIKSENESIRLLYVAGTRARRTLHLIGHAELEEDPSGRRLRDPRPDTLLAHIWTTVKPAFETALSNYPGQQESFTDERSNPPLRRVPQGWRPPPLPPAVPLRRSRVDPDDREDGGPAGSETLRLLGTLTHSLLETMAREGLDQWLASRITGLRSGVRATLASMGAPASDVDHAAQRIEQALLNTIADPRGKWILADHQDARSELKLAAASKGVVGHFAMDRTFVENGIRWVIDFKTAAYDGDDPDSFIESERRAYQEQLERYANLLGALDFRPIRAGLYFPLLNRWVEWEPQQGR